MGITHHLSLANYPSRQQTCHAAKQRLHNPVQAIPAAGNQTASSAIKVVCPLMPVIAALSEGTEIAV
jgi:hypothetical protein